jgi:hypothetical protein
VARVVGHQDERAVARQVVRAPSMVTRTPVSGRARDRSSAPPASATARSGQHDEQPADDGQDTEDAQGPDTVEHLSGLPTPPAGADRHRAGRRERDLRVVARAPGRGGDRARTSSRAAGERSPRRPRSAHLRAVVPTPSPRRPAGPGAFGPSPASRRAARPRTAPRSAPAVRPRTRCRARGPPPARLEADVSRRMSPTDVSHEIAHRHQHRLDRMVTAGVEMLPTFGLHGPASAQGSSRVAPTGHPVPGASTPYGRPGFPSGLVVTKPRRTCGATAGTGGSEIPGDSGQTRAVRAERSRRRAASKPGPHRSRTPAADANGHARVHRRSVDPGTNPSRDLDALRTTRTALQAVRETSQPEGARSDDRPEQDSGEL